MAYKGTEYPSAGGMIKASFEPGEPVLSSSNSPPSINLGKRFLTLL